MNFRLDNLFLFFSFVAGLVAIRLLMFLILSIIAKYDREYIRLWWRVQRRGRRHEWVVYYKNGEHTGKLRYNEAYGCAEVFNGEIRHEP